MQNQDDAKRDREHKGRWHQTRGRLIACLNTLHYLCLCQPSEPARLGRRGSSSCRQMHSRSWPHSVAAETSGLLLVEDSSRYLESSEYRPASRIAAEACRRRGKNPIHSRVSEHCSIRLAVFCAIHRETLGCVGIDMAVSVAAKGSPWEECHMASSGTAQMQK